LLLGLWTLYRRGPTSAVAAAEAEGAPPVVPRVVVPGR
jgi:hypothetical protein